MKHNYKATFRIDVGDAIPGVGELVNELNTLASSMGCSEQLRVHADIFEMSVSVNRKLTEKEEYKMKRILESEVVSRFPQYDIRLTEFSSQSGNALQSVV